MIYTCPDCGLSHDMTPCFDQAADCDCCHAILETASRPFSGGVLIEIRHALTELGYWIRPYSDKLDARCWRWKRPGCRPYFLEADGTVRPGRWGR